MHVVRQSVEMNFDELFFVVVVFIVLFLLVPNWDTK